VGIDDSPNDRLRHSTIVAIHDRQKRRLDAGSRGNGIDVIRVESGQPLGSQDGEWDERKPRRETVEEPCVVGHGVAIRIEGRLYEIARTSVCRRSRSTATPPMEWPISTKPSRVPGFQSASPRGRGLVSSGAW
jgi:hypothetical protein